MHHGTMFARVLRWLSCLVVLLAIGSCGGGGGGGAAGSTDAGAMTLEQRSLAMDRVAHHFEGITGDAATTTPAQWEELREWVLDQPEFIDAGVGDQSLWARFSDGRWFLYTDDWRPLPGSTATASRQAVPALRQAIVNVPASSDALILSFTGAEFAAGADAIAHMTDALQERGWTVDTRHALTVDALKTHGDIGFLYVATHSGRFGPTEDKQFALMTDDMATEENDQAYAGDLDDGTLIYHRARSFGDLVQSRDPRYAITQKFVGKYMHFAPESLVILLSCHSGSTWGGAEGFRLALQKLGAGTIVGWDGYASGYAFEAADLMVDRLAGMNVAYPQTPPNRPFDMNAVWSYLSDQGMLFTPPGEGQLLPTPVRRFGSGFSILQPIISEVQVVGSDKLVLHGQFGDDPATVSVGGQQFGATVSDHGSILEADIGPSAEGEVIVTTRDRTSNKRVLASWRGNLRYRQERQDPCGATFVDQMDVNLHLRGDAHGVRDEVDGMVRDNRQLLLPASDTQVHWSSSGSCSDASGLVEAWSGSGAIAFQPYDPRSEPLPALYETMLARVDAVEKRLQVMMLPGVQPRKTVQHGGDNPSTKERLTFMAELEGFLNDAGNLRDLLPMGTLLPFASSGLQVMAGENHNFDSGDAANSLLVQWGTMGATPAYDDSIGR